MKSLNEIKKEVSNLKDQAGQHIDPGIQDTIVGLRAHEIPTWFSCSGHKDKPGSFPYVDIYSDDSEVESDDYSEEKMEKKFQWIEENIKIQKKLISLLSDFYSNRETEYKYQLTLHTWIDTARVRLKSVGADLLKNMKKEEFEKELEVYQTEMKEFGEFLIGKYRG